MDDFEHTKFESKNSSLLCFLQIDKIITDLPLEFPLEFPLEKPVFSPTVSVLTGWNYKLELFIGSMFWEVF